MNLVESTSVNISTAFCRSYLRFKSLSTVIQTIDINHSVSIPVQALICTEQQVTYRLPQQSCHHLLLSRLYVSPPYMGSRSP